jgi:nitrite reductase (NO-forming)
MMNRRNVLLGAAVTALMMTAPALAADELKLPRQQVNLVAPPFVHEHEQATKQGPKIMQFKLVIEEKKMVIDNEGTTFQAMTFNGSMPGPLMVVHEGDYVEVTLVNPDTNSMPHNVDFHSATGALGGAELSLVNPGEQVTIRWKATRTGVFVYHCAPGGPMIPWHVVSGMNGAVMVLPRKSATHAPADAPPEFRRAISASAWWSSANDGLACSILSARRDPPSPPPSSSTAPCAVVPARSSARRPRG